MWEYLARSPIALLYSLQLATPSNTTSTATTSSPAFHFLSLASFTPSSYSPFQRFLFAYILVIAPLVIAVCHWWQTGALRRGVSRVRMLVYRVQRRRRERGLAAALRAVLYHYALPFGVAVRGGAGEGRAQPERTPKSLGVLPKELSMMVLSHLSGTDVAQAQRVCRLWRDDATTPKLWKDLYKRDIDPAAEGDRPELYATFKDAYSDAWLGIVQDRALAEREKQEQHYTSSRRVADRIVAWTFIGISVACLIYALSPCLLTVLWSVVYVLASTALLSPAFVLGANYRRWSRNQNLACLAVQLVIPVLFYQYGWSLRFLLWFVRLLQIVSLTGIMAVLKPCVHGLAYDYVHAHVDIRPALRLGLMWLGIFVGLAAVVETVLFLLGDHVSELDPLMLFLYRTVMTFSRTSHFLAVYLIFTVQAYPATMYPKNLGYAATALGVLLVSELFHYVVETWLAVYFEADWMCSPWSQPLLIYVWKQFLRYALAVHILATAVPPSSYYIPPRERVISVSKVVLVAVLNEAALYFWEQDSSLHYDVALIVIRYGVVIIFGIVAYNQAPGISYNPDLPVAIGALVVCYWQVVQAHREGSASMAWPFQDVFSTLLHSPVLHEHFGLPIFDLVYSLLAETRLVLGLTWLIHYAFWVSIADKDGYYRYGMHALPSVLWISPFVAIVVERFVPNLFGAPQHSYMDVSLRVWRLSLLAAVLHFPISDWDAGRPVRYSMHSLQRLGVAGLLVATCVACHYLGIDASELSWAVRACAIVLCTGWFCVAQFMVTLTAFVAFAELMLTVSKLRRRHMNLRRALFDLLPGTATLHGVCVALLFVMPSAAAYVSTPLVDLVSYWMAEICSVATTLGLIFAVADQAGQLGYAYAHQDTWKRHLVSFTTFLLTAAGFALVAHELPAVSPHYLWRGIFHTLNTVSNTLQPVEMCHACLPFV